MRFRPEFDRKNWLGPIEIFLESFGPPVPLFALAGSYSLPELVPLPLVPLPVLKFRFMRTGGLLQHKSTYRLVNSSLANTRRNDEPTYSTSPV